MCIDGDYGGRSIEDRSSKSVGHFSQCSFDRELMKQIIAGSGFDVAKSFPVGLATLTQRGNFHRRNSNDHPSDAGTSSLASGCRVAAMVVVVLPEQDAA